MSSVKRNLKISSNLLLWITWRKRSEASHLSSLTFFKPEFMSLASPHPLWSTAGSNPYEVSKAIQQARLLSGRYRTESLCSHWSNNREGWCQGTHCQNQIENLEHILLFCPSYESLRERHHHLWMTCKCQVTRDLLKSIFSCEPAYSIQLLLDCSPLSNVILAVQEHGASIHQNIFKMTRTYCYAVHRQRLKMLGRWKYFS